MVSIDLAKPTAILLADCYKTALNDLPHSTGRGVVQNCETVLQAARTAGLLVCYSATVFREGYVEINPANKLFGPRKAANNPPISVPSELIHPALAPQRGDVVIGKHRVSALHGTELDLVWRANSIENVILLGYATSGVITSTLRAAADLDYRIFVVEDCCADADVDAHDFLMKKLFPPQAKIASAAEISRIFNAQAPVIKGY